MQTLGHFEQVSPQKYNQIVEALNGVSQMTVAPPLEINRAGGRLNIRLVSKGFVGAVTDRQIASSSSSSSMSSSSSAQPANHWIYTIQEVQVSQFGQWTYVTNGRIVQAYEWNDNRVLLGTVVFVEPFGHNATEDSADWRFDHVTDPVQLVVLTTTSDTPPAGYLDAAVVTFDPLNNTLVSQEYIWLRDLNN